MTQRQPKVGGSSLGSLALAIVCFVSGAWLLFYSGLPDRVSAVSFGRVDGLYIAPEVGALAPDFTASTADGRQLQLSSWRGQTVIINFWATWCAPCRDEMPELQAVYAQYRDRGLRVVGVNLAEPPLIVARWRADLQLEFDLVLDPDGQTAARYYLRGQPSTYIVAPNGVVTHIFFGPADRQALDAAVRPLLPPQP